ncbi:hypothetical protein GCM10022197_38020 [Microlunatus spumicola]|uniref:Uncharacterized protein n=1 Tax=Microlunatus spumicola TaxID=81499 RepID=A0ABP6Y5B8_9ACTN
MREAFGQRWPDVEDVGKAPPSERNDDTRTRGGEDGAEDPREVDEHPDDAASADFSCWTEESVRLSELLRIP